MFLVKSFLGNFFLVTLQVGMKKDTKVNVFSKAGDYNRSRLYFMEQIDLIV